MKNIKKCLNLFILTLSILFIFFSCKKDITPNLCSIELSNSINYSEGFTYELDKNTAVQGTFVRLKAIPIESSKRYCILYFENEKSFAKTIKSVQDPDDSNVYYLFVNTERFVIRPILQLVPDYNSRIDLKKLENGKIELPDSYISRSNGEEYQKLDKYAGDLVEFSVIPDKFYYTEKSLITIERRDNNTPISFTQKEGEQYVFSYIMPECNVDINVSFELGFVFSDLNNTYTQGENIILKMDCNELTDKLFDELYDIYITLPFDNGKTNIQDDVNFSNPYVLDTALIEPGPFTIIITPYNDFEKELIKINGINNIPGIPDGWQTIGFKVEYSTLNGYKNFNFVTNYINESLTSSNITLKYFYEDNPSDIRVTKEYVYFDKHLSKITLSNSQYGTNEYITFWIEDEDKKIISKKIKVKIN